MTTTVVSRVDCVNLTAVGDLFPANLPHHKSCGIAASFNEHSGHPWRDAFHSCFEGADIGLANLESPLLEEDYRPYEVTFAGSRGFARFIREMGVNLVSVANNHILEHGKAGFFSTLDILRSEDIDVVGVNDKVANSIYSYRKNGITVSFSAYNAIRDIENPSLHVDFTVRNVLETLKRMGDSDFKVLVFHWGNEYVHIPSFTQLSLAKKFIDAGADIIIGHHPHVIQPMLKYKRGVILFSLGNFLFDLTYRENIRLGMIAKIELVKGSPPVCRLRGIRMDDNYSPVLLEEDKFQRILSRHNELFSRFQTLSEVEYNKSYTSMWKINRLVQRVWMKKDLLAHLSELSLKDFLTFPRRA